MANVSTKSRTNTTHIVSEVINGVDHEFEVTFEPSEYNEISVKISSNGKSAVVGYISRDDYAQSPREVCDNLDHMISFHNRYTLGDKHSFKDSEEFLKSLCEEAVGYEKWEKLLERAEKKVEVAYKAGETQSQKGRESFWSTQDQIMQELYDSILEKNYVMLSVGIYDHSGITMYTGVTRGWDNSNVGWIYMSKAEILENWSGKVLTPALKAKAIEFMQASVEEYDKYLTGDVWGVCYETFNNIAEEGEEPEWEEDEQDACWGFFGDTYAEEELASGMPHWEEQIEATVPEKEAADQPILFQEV